MTENRKKENLWNRLKSKFQRDDKGRIIVPNKPAYGIIAVLIIIILVANAMLLRRSYAEEADDSWEILYTSTEDSMKILTHDYNAESVKEYKYRISSDGGTHWSTWQNENVFGLDTKVTGQYERVEAGTFESVQKFYLFRCNECGDELYATNDVINGTHSCGGNFYKVTLDEAKLGEKIEISQRLYYLYKCPIDEDEVYVRRGGVYINDYKKIEEMQHCENIVKYQQGTKYNIQVKRTLKDNTSSIKTLSQVQLNTDSHKHTEDCYIGHNHTASGCTQITHTHVDKCYPLEKKEYYFEMDLDSDGFAFRNLHNILESNRIYIC